MLSLVIPTYNEIDNIVTLVRRVHGVLENTGPAFEIIVVDDDSPDMTWKAVQDMRSEYPCLRVIRRFNGRGLARAVLRGWQESRGDTLAVMDGYLQHPPETLPLLLNALNRDSVDVVVASRHIRGGGINRWNLIRRIISWGAALIATWILPGTLATVLDPMSGYFVLRRSVIEGCCLQPEGYKILLEVLVRGRYRAVEEIPYTFVQRKWGSSKLGARQYIEFITHLIRLSWDAGELSRLLRFCIVGSSGIIVNVATLAALTPVGVAYLWAGVFAVESAIISNFLLNDFWSFGNLESLAKDLRARVMRFFKFNAFCTVGALINLLILWSLTQFLGVQSYNQKVWK